MKKILNPRVFAGILMTALIFTFTPASALTTTTFEKDVISWTNYKRVERDKVAVKHNWCTDKYAERRAAWMASHRVLKHQSMGTILDACNLSGVSENIAFGFSSGHNVVGAWMRSPGHRTNLLNSRMRLIGVGAAQDKYGVWWVSQVFGRK